jgi:lipopolysaccharide/colanic/teichoic acid biosynthesis glycosyltransferase
LSYPALWSAPGHGTPRPGVPRWKRWCDCAIAGPLLVLCAPIILLAVVAVRLTSRGPGIYTQTRLGLARRPFTIYKIRTMAHNCEAKTGARWSSGKSDARVTRLGRFLRKTHIDELPQLWNVLRGDMALVGPRPERPEIITQIEPLVPGYAQRLTVLPGVTGLAQVQLPPDTTVESVRRKVRYDAYYAAHLSLWLDLRLILVTAGKMLGLVAPVRALLRVPGPAAVEAARPAPLVLVLPEPAEPAEPAEPLEPAPQTAQNPA